MEKTLRLIQPLAEELPRGLAIETRYAGATDTKGSRIIATCKRDNDATFRAVVPYDDAEGQLNAHYIAALAVLQKIEAQNSCFDFTIQSVGSTAESYVFVTLATCKTCQD